MKFGLLEIALSAMVLGVLDCAAAPANPERLRKSTASIPKAYLSPAALASSADGHTLFIACATANQIGIFDVDSGKFRKQLRMPSSPSGLVLSADGTRLYVTCAAPESSVCVVAVPTGKVMATIHTGHTAMSPVLGRDGITLFVCNRFNNEVVQLDLRQRREVARIPVDREPVAEALTPDGKYLFVANHIHTGPSDIGVVASTVTVIDTAARKVVKRIALPNGSTLLRGICASPDGRFVAVTHILARFHLPTTQVEHGWMNDNALSFIDVADLKLVNTVLLDDWERGAANPWAVGWSADGKWLCVTHAGTHELSVVDAPALLAKLAALPPPSREAAQSGYSSAARTTADVPNDLAFLVGLRTRLKLDGNGPRSLTLAGHRVFAGDYFSDSLSTVDLDHLDRPPAELALSRTSEVSAAREGEKFFNDGTLCLQGWQSCASCHSSDARVDGMNWDLLNDGIGNPKNVKSLLLSFQTPPVMSMGVRADAATAIRAGIRYILFSRLPEKYPAAIDEYIKTLIPTPSPFLVGGKLSAAAQRGRTLFFDPAVGCAHCHSPPLYTDLKPHEVGAGKFDESTDAFYTPTLVEAWRTAPYLHDGSAATVQEAITIHNRQNLRGRTSQLSPAQVEDLVTFVLSL